MNIYDKNGNILLDAILTKSAEHEEELMRSNFIRLSYDDGVGEELPVDAYIIPYNDGVQYRLFEPYKPEQRTVARFHYEPQFQHPKMYLGKVFFTRTSYENGDRTKPIPLIDWSYTGFVGTLLQYFCDAINDALGLSGNDIIEPVAVGEFENIVSTSFTAQDILSALTNVANQLECEWHIDWSQKTLYFGHIKIDRSEPSQPVLEVDSNIAVPSVRNSKEGYWNAYQPQGSSRNITVRASSGENVQANVRLTLNKTTYPDGIIYTDGEGNTLTKAQFDALGLIPYIKSVIYENVYPKLDLFVYDVRYRERYLLDENGDKVIDHYEGTTPVYKRYAVWYFQLAYPTYNQQGKVTGWTRYTIDPETQVIDGKALMGAFQANTRTGAETSPLAGQGSGDGDGHYGFELRYHETGEVIPPESEGDTGVTIKAGDYEIIFQQKDDLIIPTTKAIGMIPKGVKVNGAEVTDLNSLTNKSDGLKGNVVNLYNIVMSDDYLVSAQDELKNETLKTIAHDTEDNNTYTFKALETAFVQSNPNLYIGRKVTYRNGDYELETRVMKLVTKLDYSFDQEITVGNEVIKGNQTTMREKVDTLVTAFAQGGGGMSQSQIQRLIQNWVTPRFLSKLNDDTAQGFIRMMHGLQVGRNEFDANAIGAGGVFREEKTDPTNPDSPTLSNIVADKIYIRLKAYFDTVEIRKFLHSGGNRIASVAGAKCIRVVGLDSNDNVTETLADIVKYRCYFRGKDDEDTVTNDFEVGDLVYCHVTNVSSGVLNQHSFWRLVVGKSMSVNGENEHYIDLSNTTNDVTVTVDVGGTPTSYTHKGMLQDSDIPLPQDDIIQLGNIYDVDRQGAIIEYVSGTDAPSYKIYQHINDYTLEGKVQIGIYYNSGTGRAKMDVYGDMFIGAKPDPQTGVSPTYIEYKQDDGTQQHKPSLKIKAKVEMTASESTINGTPISQYTFYDDAWIQPQLDNLQSQIDGSIETLYGDIDPSIPGNDPYKNYTTDEKEKHLGDMYYNSTTGYAYRYDKKVNGGTTTYGWTLIRDTGITKAIADAAAALGLAGTKAKVYVTTAGTLPTKPYSVNDLWVNATYPANGSTYSNEILKCITACGESGTPNISHWTKASKYTDDTYAHGFDFLTSNLARLSSTEIAGGLVLSSLIGLRDTNNLIQSGINGIIESAKKGNGIAAWYGGEQGDSEDQSHYSGVTRWAKSLFRFDGSGYLAGGNITWDATGKVTIKDLHTDDGNLSVDVLQEMSAFRNMFDLSLWESASRIKPLQNFEVLKITRGSGFAKSDSDVLTYGELKGEFLTTSFFDELFQLYNNTTKINANGTIPTNKTNLNIKAMFGFWTEKYISALGSNDSGGGGGGASALYDLLDVQSNSGGTAVEGAVNGNVLTYDGSKWKGVAPSAGTVTSVKVGTTPYSPVNGVVSLPAYPTLSAATASALGGIKIGYSASGTNYAVALDANDKAYVSVPWTNTWRNVYVGGTSKIGTGTGTKAFNFVGDGKTTVSFLAAGTGDGQSGSANYFTIKISSTWRGIQDNLTSTSAVDSLSANQGKVLKGLVDKLQGYFTDGSANTAVALKTARTLWGQSFDGTANVSGAITGATTISASSNVSVGGTLSVTGATTLSSTLSVANAITLSGNTVAKKRIYFGDTSHYIELDTNGYFHFSHGLYSDSFVSALGLNSSGGGGGGGAGDVTWDLLASSSDTRPIALSHLTTALSGYATQSWVQNQGYITSYTDTKNTAGSTNTSSKIFLIGATSQAANPQTYSHDTAYVGTDGCLYSGGTKVLTAHQSLSNYVTLNSAQTISATKTFSAQQAFTVAQGTAPFTVASTTKVENLNADYLDGLGADAFYHLTGGINLNASETNLVNIDILNTIGDYYCSANASFQYISTLPSKITKAFRLRVGNFFTGTRYVYQRIQQYSDTAVYERYSSASTLNYGKWYQVQGDFERVSTLEGYFSSGSAKTAVALKTARSLWGNSFDGTEDINGKISVGYTASSTTGEIYADSATKFHIDTASGGYMYFGVGSSADTTNGIAVMLSSTYFKPLNANTGVFNLGTSEARWKGIYGNTLNLSSNATISGTLSVTGATTLSSTLKVANTITLNGGTAAKQRIYFDATHYIELDANGYFHFSHGLYSDSFVSALGLNSSGGGGGGAGDGDVTWDLLASNDTRPINISHLTGALNGYATTSWVNTQLGNYYSSTASRTANTVLAAPNGSAGAATFRALVAADIPNLNASKITAGTFAAARIPDLSGTYVTLTGTQTITGGKTFSGTNNSILTVDRNNTDPTWIKFAKNGTVLGYLGVNSSNEARYHNGTNDYKIWHSGNLTPSDYLPLSGGTMTGTLKMGTNHYIYGADESGGSMVYFDGNRTVVGSVGETSTKATHLRSITGHLTCGTSTTASYTIWDSGNDGSDSGLDADLLDGYHAIGEGTGNIIKQGYINIAATTEEKWYKIATIPTSSHMSNFLLNISTLYVYGQYAECLVSIGARTTSSYFFHTIDGIAGNIPASYVRLYYNTYSDGLEVYFKAPVSTTNNRTVVTKVIAESRRSGQLLDLITLEKGTTIEPTSGWSYVEMEYVKYLGDASTATSLKTARTIWGQDFDGTANVSGAISGATTISASSNVSVGGTLSVTGATTLTGNTTLGGNLYLGNNKYVFFKNTDAADIDCFRLNSSNRLIIGYGLRSTASSYTSIYAGKSGMYLYTNGTTARMFIDSAGNVGIGTTSPSHKLYVAGTFYASGNSSIGGTTDMAGSLTLNNNLKINFKNSAGTAMSCLTMDSNNNLVLGESMASNSYNTYVRGNNVNVQARNASGGQSNVCVFTKDYVHALVGFYSDSYVSGLGQNTSSDIRKKDIKENFAIDIDDIAAAPSVRYLWKENKALGLQVGSIAQYWQKVLPESVHEDGDGYLSMQYGVIALLASISAARKIQDHERRIKDLEKENKRLRTEVEQLKTA